MINEENSKQVLLDYAFEKYGDRFQEFHDKFYDEFPYKYGDLPEEAYFRNFADWLVFEKAIPDTGQTILEEFVDEHTDLDEEMKQELLRMGNVVSSRFVVTSKKRLSLKIKDLNSRETYNVTLDSDNPYLCRNALVTGRIHPSGNSFRFLGIFFVQNTPYIWDVDVVMEQFNESRIADAEGITVYPKSKLTAIFNKYPSSWVNGTCEKLGLSSKGKKNIKVKNVAAKVKSDLKSILDSIPEKSREALKLVLDNGGFVKYGKLKGYDDEITFWWKEDPPTSTIGILRLNALLAVGKMPMAGRMYRVALIPADIRDELQNLL
jgi:hypothetical protein